MRYKEDSMKSVENSRKRKNSDFSECNSAKKPFSLDREDVRQIKPCAEHLIRFMYRVDLSILFTLRKHIFKDKYPQVKIDLRGSEVDDSNIILRNGNEYLIIQVDDSNSINEIDFVQLFIKGKKFHNLNYYFECFLQNLIYELNGKSNFKFNDREMNPNVNCFNLELNNGTIDIDNIKSIKFNLISYIVYTNSDLALTDEYILKGTHGKIPRSLKFIPVTAEEKVILHDFLSLDGHENFLYKISKNKIVREEIFKKLEISPLMRKKLQKNESFENSEKSLKKLFLDKLVFAVKQPKREILNLVIKKEIRKRKLNSGYQKFQGEFLKKFLNSQNEKRVKKVYSFSNILYEFSLFLSFLHEMLFMKKISAIHIEKIDQSSNFSVEYKNKYLLIKAFKTNEKIGFNHLFPPKVQEKKSSSSLNKLFSFFVQETNRNIKFILIISNSSLDLDEDQKLKKYRSKDFSTLKFEMIDTELKKYKVFKYLPVKKKCLYNLSKEEKLLTLLEFPLLSNIKPITIQEKQEIKEKFIDKLVFVLDQELDMDSLIENREVSCDIPYNYEILQEVLLRYLESKDTIITEERIQKFIHDIKMKKSSQEESQRRNTDEEIQFMRTVDPNMFSDSILEFLLSEDRLSVLKKNRINPLNLAKLIAGSDYENAPTVFLEVFELWIVDGKKSFYLKILEENHIELSNFCNILYKSGNQAAENFKALFNLLFDSKGNKRDFLVKILKNGIKISNLSTIIQEAPKDILKCIKNLLNVWFNEDWSKTKYLKTLEKNGVTLSNLTNILTATDDKAPEIFLNLYELWFDQEGNKSEYLKNLEYNGIDLGNICCKLYKSGKNATLLFKELYNLWFDCKGSKSKCLLTLEKEGISLSTVDAILHGSNSDFLQSFRELYNVWFDEKGNKRKCLLILDRENIQYSFFFNIIYNAKNKGASSFIDLFNFCFDASGSKTRFLTNLDRNNINLEKVSNILCFSGVKAVKTFENLHNLWFDEEGNKRDTLRNFEIRGVGVDEISNVLYKSGANAIRDFKEFHSFWFDVDGKRTKFLKLLENNGTSLKMFVNIFDATKNNALKVSKELFNVWFDERGKKRMFLRKLQNERINLDRIIQAVIYHGGNSAVKIFKNFYDLWFDTEGNERENLKNLKMEELNIRIILDILDGTKSGVIKIFKRFHKILFHAESRNPLQKLKEKGVNLSNVAKLLEGSGDSVVKNYKKIYFTFIDKNEKKRKIFRDFVKKKNKNKKFTVDDLCDIFRGTKDRFEHALKMLHRTFYDENGKRKHYLSDFFDNDFTSNDITCLLSESGEYAHLILKEFHKHCFNKQEKGLKRLKNFVSLGFTKSDICRLMSGGNNFKEFYQFSFGGETEIFIHHFLNNDFIPKRLADIFQGPANKNLCQALRDFHETCFDKRGNKRQILIDFYEVGLEAKYLTMILHRTGNSATRVLIHFHELCFKKNYLKHFLVEKEVFKVKNLSKLLLRIEMDVCKVFEGLHQLCFDEEGCKTNFLSKIIKKDKNNVFDVLYKKVNI